MIELVIHGRGGRGGVTLAKLIAGAYYRRGLHVQAFGVYGAERMGAPVQAFVRVDEREIVVHNAITTPDHVVVVDASLAAPEVAENMRDGGWVVVNSPHPPEAFAACFPGRNVATVDASAIAADNGLGTRAVPIVNTALLGSVGRVLGLELGDVEGALADAGFGGPNIAAARRAFAGTVTEAEPGEVAAPAPVPPHAHLGFLDERVGRRPTTHTGAWASVRPHTRELLPLCSDACPAGNDVRGFVRAAAAGDDAVALGILLGTSPLPGVCGRVCPAPCMSACNRRELDGAVDVRDIERALADRAPWPRASRGAPCGPVAVVGAGPAGLSAAYQLGRLGHPVLLVEASAHLGGVLRSGIPAYRLPRDVLDREIAFVLEHGVTVRTGQRVDRDVLRGLADESCAVLVATGLQAQRDLDLGGDSVSVEQGLDFLAAVQGGRVDLTGEAVVVAGGGTTAMDAARTAMRLGAREVRVVYRRTRGEMPAIAEEVEEALEEGVRVDELVTPVGLGGGEKHGMLACRRMRLGEPDQSGRPRPVPLDGPGSRVELACDRLLLALGQGRDLSLLPPEAQPPRGPFHLRGASTPVYAAGDFAGGEGTVAAAIGSGRRAALAIHVALAGADAVGRMDAGGRIDAAGRMDAAAGVPASGPAPGAALAGPDVVHAGAFSRVPGEPVSRLSPRKRRTGFAEVRRGFAEQPGRDAVRAEAARCFVCGLCTGCDTCVVYCPEGVLRRPEGGLPEADYDYCKGCGLCVATCPRGVMFTEAV
jgi:2-oxoacid:acceptor oxidoreductase gamma subunit (pyruvate/2-ketoisovalerate family)